MGETTQHVLIEALAARFGGTAQATVELARQLAKRPEIDHIAVLTAPRSIVRQRLNEEAGVTCIDVATGRPEIVRRTVWQATRLPGLVARGRYDALISMSGILPRDPGCRVACVLGNSAMYASGSPADWLRRQAVRRTTSRGARLLAPSRLMADLVVASTGVPCEVAPLGVDHAYFRPAERPGTEILCVADLYVHKRHDLLLDSWSSLRAPRPTLRIVGDPAVDPANYARLRARLELLPDADKVIVEHGIPHTRMPDLYRRARVFVLPSEHESFCLPLAESMACGVPAIVRDLASLRETGGSGTTYVDGDDAASWASAIQALLDDDPRYATARASAIAAARRFSWADFADRVAEALKPRR